MFEQTAPAASVVQRLYRRRPRQRSPEAAVKIMKTEYVPPTEIGRQRRAWLKEHVRPGMTFDEAVRLNDEAFRLFPATDEERQQKFESLKDVPEFVL